MKSIKPLLFGGPGSSTLLGDVGLAIARVGIGMLLAWNHGYGKVWGEQGFGPSDKFIAGVTQLGFPAPTLFAWCAALTEFLGAILLALGLLTRPVAAILCFNMAVAAFGTHLHQGLSKQEPALMYLLPFAMFALVGAGRISVDHLIRGNRA
jgi:putative oxidoreductase